MGYFSSDTGVATVSETGKTKTMGVGSCTVYILANNGVRTSVRATMK